jgi:phenylalanyl-tRNA synthetase beta chain
MKVSYNWLKDYLPLDVDPHLLAEKLSLVGFEVEEVIENRLDFPYVVVGKILEVEKHPNADKLTVCKVDVGSNSFLNIICGAPNVRKDQIVPVAMVGADLPNGLRIHKAKIRGAESEGMICSEQELGVSDNAEGIWVLASNLPLGKPLAEALDFETDYVLDIAVTPNRPDALSHIGIAREVAAIFDLRFSTPKPKFPELKEPTSSLVTVDISSPESCPRYAARLIRNVKIGTSPTWLARRLESVGMRLINNIVDITNYILMETGQPLHAFDYDLLEGGRIIVRESKEGESFTTLDDKNHKLQAGTVLICDAAKPVAIGGIMGGLNSEVNNDTKNILLESAYFTPQNIQKSLRYLNINSEASQRFERGTDPNGVLYAQDRANELMVKLANGEVYNGAVDNYPKEIYPVEIQLKDEQINTLLGLNLPRNEMAGILKKIEIEVNGDSVKVPTFRPDLERVADIAEEISRLYGLDNIVSSEKSNIKYDYDRNLFDNYVDELKSILTGMGFQEVITNSMINREKWEELTGENIYPILNPISHDMSGLRNNLSLSLLNVLQWNVNRQIKDLRIFEITRVFHHPDSLKKLPGEELRLAVALTGEMESNLWYSNRQLIDFYSVKGFIESFLDKISLDSIQLISYDNFVYGDQALAIVVDGKTIGYFGKVKERLQNYFDIETPVYIADFRVASLSSLAQKPKIYAAIPKYPFVERDLAVIVDENVEAAKLIETVENNRITDLRKVTIFDVYRGEQIEADKKSIALRFIFQSKDKTLTEEEETASMNKIIKILEQRHQSKIRL